MNLTHPLALAWAALAIPIVIFYILKIRLRRVPVSTILFWEQIFEEKRPRSIWQRLRHLVSLLVQLAFLMLLVFALCEPFFRWELRQARRLVLVVDNSASMNATDVAPTRLAKAKAEAKTIIDDLRFMDEVAIVSAGSEPRVYCGLTGHQRTLRTSVDAIQPTDGPTHVKEAVALARRLLADHKNRKVVILSDAAFDDATGLSKDQDVEIVSIGTKAGNVGITRLQARRSLLDPVGYQILAEVTNSSDQEVQCRLEVSLEQEIIDVVPLKLAPNGKWSQTFEKTSTEGGKLLVKLDHKDALATDNQATALLPKREIKQVELVTDGNLFVEKVLEANPLVKLDTSKDLPKSISVGAITVLHKKVPEKLPSGPVLVIEPAGSCDLWDLGETLLNPIVTKQDKDSPLMANVRLDNVLMPEARKLTPKGTAKLLAVSVEGDPLLCTFERPEGKVLVLSVNLDKGDLPLQTAFPILVANALGWFAGTKGELLEARSTGAVAELELPSQPGVVDSQGTIALRAPDGVSQPVPMDGQKATIGPLDHCGIWSLVRKPGENADKSKVDAKKGEAEKSVLEVACNLANARESDLRAPEGLKAKADVAQAGFGGWPIWFAMIVLAWILATGEWVCYQRRWIS
ncbi:vWA domain-containing protein [Singulisphaera sp. PoT]|uniref:vWA domain-containing protein n=1 Tax=Singulisphaera sp. PoT TaxID=3411797 RepID=UPI003BF5F6A2